MLPARGVGVIELRGESLTPGYITMGGFMPAQDENGWYDTGDLGYQIDNGHVVVCGRVKDVIIMAGRNIYPTDIERAAGRVEGVRPGAPCAVRLDAGHSRETFAVAVESNAWQDPDRGAPDRAPGGPRGGHRGRRAAAQRRRARPGHHPEDPVGQAASGQLGPAGHLNNAEQSQKHLNTPCTRCFRVCSRENQASCFSA